MQQSTEAQKQASEQARIELERVSQLAKEEKQKYGQEIKELRGSLEDQQKKTEEIKTKSEEKSADYRAISDALYKIRKEKDKIE